MIIRCPHCGSLQVESIASIQDDPRVDDYYCEECFEMFEVLFPPDYDEEDVESELD